MTTRIVVPSNGSARSLAAMGPGGALASQLGIPCEVVSVVSAEGEVAARESELLDALHRGGNENVQVRVEVSSLPTDVLLKDSADGALLCMTTHARGPLRELMLGSVATDVVRRAHRPVALVGPRLSVYWTPPVRALLVCMDHSSQATNALRFAVELASSLGADLHLLHVIPQTEISEAEGGSHGPDWLTGADWHTGSAQGELPGAADHRAGRWEREHTAEWEYLKDHAERVRQETGLATDWAVLQNPYPATAVTQFADAVPGALIVTGTHDVSPLQRFGMGSFAFSVMRSAGAPVVVVSS